MKAQPRGDRMKLHYLIFLITSVLFWGCATVTDPKNPRAKYRVSYADTNHDGSIDSARYQGDGMDRNFSFSDTDRDGRYDECTIVGVGLSRKPVDYPVYLDPEKKRLNRAFLSPP
jgi:uncharacterized protein YceK